MSNLANAVRRIGVAVFGGVIASVAAVASCHAQTEVRVIKIATCGECKPLAWGALGDDPQGYEPDMLRAVNAKLPQYKFEMTGLPDEAQQTGLSTGKYDMSVGGYLKTPERAAQFMIPDSVIGASLMKIWHRKEDNISEIKDLVGKRLSPNDAGGGTYRFLMDWQAAHSQYKLDVSATNAGIPVPYRLEAIAKGKYDAWVYPSYVGQQTIIDDQKLDVVGSEPVLVANTYVLISHRLGNDVLAKDVDKALKELRDDGTMAKLSMKWFSEDITKYIQ
ncbi:transporter substrate-binding domain-containing protein [Labrys wisconsinensis]|uniref:L-cystine transport system substrate-binding protein n=1 Tax=Labrys wisconsinensis TaxID=425677 RepID=A0ABU0J6Y8_9HYPH|nr:transporter substrate-binding domain-containing protein [Labrys wisconsinensis]MDQ0470035.1 L-cystine transport system substrate-binding protein [Labrys wisconsinensis]